LPVEKIIFSYIKIFKHFFIRASDPISSDNSVTENYLNMRDEKKCSIIFSGGIMYVSFLTFVIPQKCAYKHALPYISSLKENRIGLIRYPREKAFWMGGAFILYNYVRIL